MLLPIAIAILPEASYGSIFKANGTNEAKTNGNSEKKILDSIPEHSFQNKRHGHSILSDAQKTPTPPIKSYQHVILNSKFPYGDGSGGQNLSPVVFLPQILDDSSIYNIGLEE